MMNIGTQTNSLVNHLYSRMTVGAPNPEVGMGATLLSWSERNPGTVISIEKNIIAVQHDDYKRIDSNGMSEIQEYEYVPNKGGLISYFRVNKNGSFSAIYRNKETGRWNKSSSGYGLILGRREKYYDYSF